MIMARDGEGTDWAASSKEVEFDRSARRRVASERSVAIALARASVPYPRFAPSYWKAMVLLISEPGYADAGISPTS